MTPHQKDLARHALGLPNQFKRSYRNRYFAAPGSADWLLWKGMTDAGLALHTPAEKGKTLDFFCLTRAGADRALGAKERLDMEDFPPISAH